MITNEPTVTTFKHTYSPPNHKHGVGHDLMICSLSFSISSCSKRRTHTRIHFPNPCPLYLKALRRSRVIEGKNCIGFLLCGGGHLLTVSGTQIVEVLECLGLEARINGISIPQGVNLIRTWLNLSWQVRKNHSTLIFSFIITHLN